MRCKAVLVLLSLAVAAPAHGQTMRDKIRDLFRFGNCGEFICLGVGPGNHEDHFKPAADTNGTLLINFISNAVGLAISNVPLGSTSSGAQFTFDSAGNPVTRSGPAGPIFAERAQTLGRKRFYVGLNVTGASFTSIRGTKLSNLGSTFTHEDTPPTGLGLPSFEYDTVHVQTDMSASFQTGMFFASYGVSNTVDIGIAIPIVHVSFSGRSIGTIVNTGPESPPDHFWLDNGGVVDTTSASGSSTGIGDIALRAKINFYQSATTGAAFLVNVRLPTGDEDNLLGTGSTQIDAVGVVSGRYSQLEPHLNVGYQYRSSSTLNSTVLTAAGVDALVGGSVTLAGDIIGEWQLGDSKLTLPAPANYVDGSVVSRTTIPDQRDNLVAGSFGAKFTFGHGYTALANAIIPFTNAGLKSDVTWTVGLQKNF